MNSRAVHSGASAARPEMNNSPAKGTLNQVVRILISAVLIALFMVVAIKKGHAADIAATPANYKDLLNTLKPGDTLKLAGGNYPLLSLTGVAGTAANWITIEGPSSGTPATITINPANPGCCNIIQLANVSYVALKSLRIDSALVDAIDGVNARGLTHNVLVENCTFVGQGSHQQTVAISTKGTAHSWTVRGNTILEAGTGMYFGDSNGGQPFINGLIENNLIVDTIGYNAQFKFQLPYTQPAGLGAGPYKTVIRNNVFIKNKPQSSWPAALVDGPRPNLLVGGFPTSGYGSNDSYEIYGNFFYENKDGESLFQGAGWVSLHDNVFVGGSRAGMALQNHDLPLRRAYVYNNTIYARGQGISVAGASLEDSLVTGNAVFTDQGISAPVQKDNVVDTPANAANHVNQPSYVLGSMDFYPKAGRLKGSALDLSKMTGQVDYNRDFNGTSKGAFEYRGAYAGEGTNPGWRLTNAIKNSVGSTIPPGGTNDTTPPARPTGLRVR